MKHNHHKHVAELVAAGEKIAAALSAVLLGTKDPRSKAFRDTVNSRIEAWSDACDNRSGGNT